MQDGRPPVIELKGVTASQARSLRPPTYPPFGAAHGKCPDTNLYMHNRWLCFMPSVASEGWWADPYSAAFRRRRALAVLGSLIRRGLPQRHRFGPAEPGCLPGWSGIVRGRGWCEE